MKGTLLCAVLSLLLAVSASAQPIEWPVAEGGNGHFYEWVQLDLAWTDAYGAALGMTAGDGWTGHLVTITSSDEWTFVKSILPASPPETWRVWIGLFQESTAAEPADGWLWVTGEPVTFTEWHTDEPNDDGGGEDYCEVYPYPTWPGGYAWNDLALHEYPSNGFIVEFEDGAVPAARSSWSAVKAKFEDN